MAEVKWIKIVTDIFDDEKMLLIESMPSSDSIIVIWFKLLCLAGKNNNSGVFLLNDKIAYTDEMLATIFRRDINTVRLALKSFQTYGMIEIIDNVITIPNWSKHQNLDQLEERKEYMKEYMRKYRGKQKDLIECKTNCKVNGKSNSKANVNALDIEEDIEEDIEVEREEEGDKKKRENINYQQIADMYNNTCVSFPSLVSLSDSRKKAIKARFKTYSIDDFEKLFLKAEASDFLKGKNDRNWSATFDWLIKDANMAKVLDGNYDNKDQGSHGPGTDPGGKQQQVRDMLRDWANGGE
ncbi:phage replisome organizer N-terminal domain-containing protein [Lacrimispora sp.]|uniref:phage replisome organizer N-terminal domain-containing protein n=1 Tax=Lacrimispora sp. TaxID=2719234 RepID=UPI00346101BD